MERINSLMFALIKSQIQGTLLDRSVIEPLSDEEAKRLYVLSKSQDMAHLVGSAIDKNGLLEEGEILEKYRKQTFMAVYRYQRIQFELQELCTALETAEIDHMPLKGSVIRDFYPEGWMRTSCDIDVLVRHEDLERAKEVLVGMNYRYDSEDSHDVCYFSPSGVHVELHYCLIEDYIDGKMDGPLQDVWSYASVDAGTKHRYSMSDAMYYYYHIAHMVKHYLHGGCGIRPFLDVWILCHRVEYDRSARAELLDEGGILTFSEGAETLSEVWFGNAVHTPLTKSMENYLLSSGTYGTTETRVAIQQSQKGGKLRFAMSRIWLPYSILVTHYPSLEKHKWLLPFYQVRRWFKLLFRGGVKRSANELKTNFKVSDDKQKELSEMLKQLRLKE